MRKLWLAISLFCGVTMLATAAERPLAIIGAMPEEISLLNSKLTDKQTISHLGIKFYRGLLAGRPVVLVKSGEGKVNAAMTTTLLLDRFQPAAVIFTGIAGGLAPTLHPGDLVIGKALFQHDCGDFTNAGLQTGPTKNPFTDRANELMFPSSPLLVSLAEQAVEKVKLESVHPGTATRAMVGVIATGDSFVASAAKGAELYRKFQALAVEMEGAAVAQVCAQQGCPFVVIRSISDHADAGADVDVQRFCRVAADNSATLVEAMVRAFPAK